MHWKKIQWQIHLRTKKKLIPLYLWWCIPPTNFIDPSVNRKKTAEKRPCIEDYARLSRQQTSVARKGVTNRGVFSRRITTCTSGTLRQLLQLLPQSACHH